MCKNDDKEHIARYFIGVTIAIEIILLVFLFLTFWYYNPKDLLKALALGLIILWVGVLVGYYSWAIYFYNINLGITDKDWEDIEKSRSTTSKIEEPKDNPNAEETFGLPPGTVRGTIALTLLIGTLAMILVSFNKDSIVKDNEVFIDNFDFFKTAFLMMIAFYFGSKSLEYLGFSNKSKNGEVDTSGNTNNTQNDAKG